MTTKIVFLLHHHLIVLQESQYHRIVFHFVKNVKKQLHKSPHIDHHQNQVNELQAERY